MFAGLPLPAAGDQPGRRVALVVGVNEYGSRKLENLKYAERDATDLAKVLADADFVVRTLLGSADGADAATRANVEAALDRLLKTVGKKDTVLIALSGHGEQLIVKEGGAAKEVPFFCPKDAVPTDPQTLVSLNAVLKALDDRGGGHNLLLVDACRNIVDPNKGSRGGMNNTRAENIGEGTAVFFSCGGRQRARETDKAGGGHGVFFHFVLEGLRGEARDDRGQVTWERLVPYVRRQVADASAGWFPDIPADEQQRPHQIANLADDPVLVASATVVIPRPDGKTYVSKTAGMKFVRIPAGTFTRGSPAEEQDYITKTSFDGKRPDWLDGESPQHEVKISKPFYLAIHAVTVGQFRRFVQDTGYQTEAESSGEGSYAFDGKEVKTNKDRNWRSPGFIQADDHPVTCVSWNDAVRYCEWLSRRDGKTYRLPTEAEWEYSCRGGRLSSQPFGIGDGRSLSSTQANFNGDDPYGGAAKGPVLERTCPVGSYPANDWGLHDMHGNVLQWCRDWFDAGYYKRSPRLDPLCDDGEQKDRVLRGGSWFFIAGDCRAARRFWFEPGIRYNLVGFRVSLRLD
jgi:formylglycine-generating enzyme required for sulfatase activity